MTSTELAVMHDDGSSLHAQMDYSKAVSSASMLPDNYRGKPADIMLAIGLGQSMGLSPAESLYRISVIKGKPTASAELIAANVRKAGHRLRVAGDETTCTATIVRADDPEFPFEVTRDLAWAERMGLSKNDNYRKQPGTMLQWRAITAVARLACPEALYGVAYTADEMLDGPRAVTAVQEPADRLGSILHPDPDPEPVEAEVVEDTPETLPGITGPQLKKMGALMREAGITERDAALLYVSDTIGHEVTSRNDLSKTEAGIVIDALERDMAGSAS